MNKTIKKDTITLALVTFMMIMASTQKTLRLLQQAFEWGDYSELSFHGQAFFFQAYNYVTSKVMAWILKTQILTEIQGY